MFAAADKDGSGRITQEELQAALDENEAFGDLTQKMARPSVFFVLLHSYADAHLTTGRFASTHREALRYRAHLRTRSSRRWTRRAPGISRSRSSWLHSRTPRPPMMPQPSAMTTTPMLNERILCNTLTCTRTVQLQP